MKKSEVLDAIEDVRYELEKMRKEIQEIKVMVQDVYDEVSINEEDA